MIRRLAALAAVLLLVVAGVVLAMSGRPQPVPERAADGLDLERLLDDALASSEGAFGRPEGAWALSLPADHGGHDGARMETWSISGHLSDPEGRHMGLDFTLTRVGLSAAPDGPDTAPWQVRAVHRGHLVLASADQALAEERLSRGAGGAAGHDGAGEVWIDEWSLAPGGGGLELAARVAGRPLRLSFTPERAPLPIGEDGTPPFRGYALTRLSVSGSLGTGPDRRPLSGTGWLDHLWGELPLPGGALASGRLRLHLDDGSDLTLLTSQRRGGRGGLTVDGLLVRPDGATETLAAPGISVTATGLWRTGPNGSVAYPVAWRVEGKGLALTLTPARDDQRHAFALPIWSGLVSAEGTRDGRAVSGRGTLQLTGYE